MAEQMHFRELIRPGTNFEFVGKRRRWIMLSVLACLAGFAMLFVNKARHGGYLNWNIDFKGGTEIIFLVDSAGSPDPGAVRGALSKGGFDGFDVSELTVDVKQPDGSLREAHGFLVRTVDFGAMPVAQQLEVAGKFADKFKDHDLQKPPRFHGDTLHVRSKKPFSEAEAAAFFKGAGLEMKPWGELATDFATPTEGTGEYDLQLSVHGIDRQYLRALEAIPGLKIHVEQVYAVGAKAGEQLRNDGIKAMFYALLLIMLYLAFRFDIRYAPGAVIALLHDAFLVVAVFAFTWTEFSLTTVAAILTVIGYSVNDTVIIFDRIRENLEKLKDKKLQRVVNISLNEVLSRSLLTSVTVFATTLMMNIFGTGGVRNFAFAMNVGVVVGAYSSLFIAAPIFIWIHNRWYAGGEDGSPGKKPARPVRKQEEPVEEEDEGGEAETA